MPKGGARPGAGRPRGSTSTKITLKKAAVVAEEAKKKGHRLAKDVMSEAMNFFVAEATRHAPGKKGRDEKLYRLFLLDAADIAKALAPYQTPRLAQTTLRADEAAPVPSVHKIEHTIKYV